jgi:hypothetical protein
MITFDQSIVITLIRCGVRLRCSNDRSVAALGQSRSPRLVENETRTKNWVVRDRDPFQETVRTSRFVQEHERSACIVASSN